MAHERTCTVCGTQYQYCKRCAQFKDLPTWKMAYCSEPCRETYIAVNKYEFGHLTAEDALEIINLNKSKVINKELIKCISKIKKEVTANKKAALEEPEPTVSADPEM